MSDTNIKVLLALSKQPGTAADVAAAIGKPHKTVGMAITRLLARGLVRVAGMDRHSFGRPAKIYEVRR